MLLYTPNNTPRLLYTIGFINKELFDEPIRLTNDRQEFVAYEGPRLNYSDEEFSLQEFFIKRTALLFEIGIQPQIIECFELNYYKVFFQTGGDLPFDIFAAIFYLLSRYEEYLPHEKDAYGRYAHTNALAFRENFLHLPLINIWLVEFKRALNEKFPDLIFHRPAFKFIPTYDIDIAYSYLHKGWKRNAGGLLRSVSRGEWTAARERLAVVAGKRKDPFDTYEWLDSLHLYCRVRAYYFFLLAGQQKEYDKNISPSHPALKDLIQYHGKGYTLGIHPSWQSGDQEELLEEEISTLELITEKKVSYSRQHYIRFELPGTYRRLLAARIEKDFSMGYGTINGFRASVASSFAWYDLGQEKESSLVLFPFCFMDANSFYEQKFTAQQALRELMTYYHTIKKVNGLMVTIWHNNFFGTDPMFAGWKDVYEVFLKEEVYWDM